MWLNRISRREALLALGALTTGSRAAGALLAVTRVDHVALSVGDIDSSLSFYRRLFGNEVLKDRKTPRRYLRLGPCYVAIAPAAAGEAKRVDHFALGIKVFNAASTKLTLESAGFKVRESNVGLFVLDPDGNSIQLWAEESWRQLNNAAPEKFPAREALFHPRGMHHVSIQVSDAASSMAFYRKLFGEPIPGSATATQTAFQAGETRIVLYNPAPNKPPKIDHFSVLVDNFDAPSALRVVKSLGARAELSKQGTLNEFYDPEGIRLQVTFPGQTYGVTPQK